MSRTSQVELLLLLFSHQVMSNSATPWTAAHQASPSFTISWSLLKLMFIEWVMPSNHFILCCPFLLLPSIFPSIRIFSSELALPAHLIHSSASDILRLIPSRVFLISVILLFVSVCLFFNSSGSLLIDSCIFSILFSRSLIIFTIVILISFSGSLPTSSHLFGLLCF